MSNASQSANTAFRRYNQAGHALRIDARNERGFLHEGSTQAHEPAETAAKSLPATKPAMAQADAIRQSVLWFFLEGFALYGASLHWLGTTAVTAIATEIDARQRQKPARSERRKSISLVSPAAGITVLERRDAIGRAASGTWIPSTRDGSASAARGRPVPICPPWLAGHDLARHRKPAGKVASRARGQQGRRRVGAIR
jgi:hypothetical protein